MYKPQRCIALYIHHTTYTKRYRVIEPPPDHIVLRSSHVDDGLSYDDDNNII